MLTKEQRQWLKKYIHKEFRYERNLDWTDQQVEQFIDTVSSLDPNFQIVKKNVAQMAKNYDWIKRNWIRQRNLQWSDRDIWDYVINRFL